MKNQILFTMYLFFGILLSAINSSCNFSTKSKETVENPIVETRSKAEKKISSIEGDWSSNTAQEYGIFKITIKYVGENKYSETITAIDGSRGVKFLTLTSEGKYHTNNEYGEYYKLTDNNIEAYDNEGYLFSMYKE